MLAIRHFHNLWISHAVQKKTSWFVWFLSPIMWSIKRINRKKDLFHHYELTPIWLREYWQVLNESMWRMCSTLMKDMEFQWSNLKTSLNETKRTAPLKASLKCNVKRRALQFNKKRSPLWYNFQPTYPVILSLSEKLLCYSIVWEHTYSVLEKQGKVNWNYSLECVTAFRSQ